MDLKTYRETVRKISPTEAARELEVSYIGLWRWEKGHTMPRKAALKRIQEWSNGQVTPSDFVCQGDDDA